MRTCCTIETPIGPLRLDAEEGALVAVHLPEGRCPPVAAVERPEDPVLAAAARQLEEYFAGRRSTFDLPLRPRLRHDLSETIIVQVAQKDFAGRRAVKFRKESRT